MAASRRTKAARLILDDPSPATTATPDLVAERPQPRLAQIVTALVVAAAIVAAAWFVGGQSGFGQIGKGGINQSLLPKVGEVAPDFTTHDLNGRQVTLSDFRGQPVWLNFWGSWCPPCRAEMPDIQRAYERLAPEGVVLLAVSLRETPQDAAEFAARNNATFTILSDPYERETGPAFPIANFPTHVFIDREGIIRSIVLSPMDVETAVAKGLEVASRD